MVSAKNNRRAVRPRADLARDRGLIGLGLGAGLIAGTAFGVAQLVGALITEGRVLTPVKRAASVLLGDLAFVVANERAVLVGVAVHLVLSAIFGFLYVAAHAALARRHLENVRWQLLLGASYGVFLWFVNFRLIARFTFPLLATVAPLPTALMHMFFYGLPLGLFVAFAVRSMQATKQPQARASR